MRSLRRPASPFDGALDASRTFLAHRSVEVGGLFLVGGAVALVAALATWSVEDPSLNHATDAPVRNLLGWGGAVAADLAMQLFGLGTLALVLPPALWGLRLLRTRRLDRPVLRAMLWLAGSAAAAAVASALPPTARWPLPTGLGGVVGDALLRGTRALLGIASSPAGALVGFVFAGVAVLGLTAACGLGLQAGESGDDEDEPAGSREDDEPGLAIVSLGALAHAAMSLRASLRRRYEAWSAARTAERYALAYPGPSPTLAARRAFADEPVERAPPPSGARREPVFDAAPPPAAVPAAPRRAPAPVLHDEVDDEEADEAFPPPPPPVAAEAPRSRVEPPASQPRPMKPVMREALPAERDDYEPPALALLAEPRRQAPVAAVSEDALEQNATLLESTLEDFGVRGSIVSVRPGPVVTLYELEPAPGTKSARVIGLSDDIARSMAAVSARVAVVQGRNAIGIELPNLRRETVYLRELLSSPAFTETPHRLALALGKTIGGEPVVADLARMPHLLVAGTTGSGKSVAINTMILSLLYRLPPEACRLIMVDPKMLELSVYDGIPHLLAPVVTDPKKAVVALKWAVREMEERYKKMSKLSVRNIDGFNARLAEARARGEVITRTVQTGFDRETGSAVYEEEVMDLTPLPYIVVIVDEMADLMMVAGKDIEGAIQRLAQMARAAGIHLIMATQRPSVDVITGTIKANFPTRISFQVTSKIDSRTILGEMGAEQLLGQGDMLYMAGGGRVTRVHGPFCSDGEVEAVVAHLKRQGRPSYLEAVTQDDEAAGSGGGAGSSGSVGGSSSAGGGEAEAPVFDAGSFGSETGSEADLYEGAVAVVLRDRKASTSYIQRRLQIGYNRAASLMERMEQEGIVGPANHAGKRDILVPEGET